MQVLLEVSTPHAQCLQPGVKCLGSAWGGDCLQVPPPWPSQTPDEHSGGCYCRCGRHAYSNQNRYETLQGSAEFVHC